ncbi:vanadium-dependent haloperoxidase [Wenzhouxiangella sp. XN201]|uniref:vanadium-dependent haloperoxidase n=1 Tax=Wenzhouxiangella sp. XN201 TaxID=2710755 RepID=UPI0013C5A2CD|nr:vanadium-dependent haloperoxidase [Wenzhouxiangella sp. XN201]NEZ03112.1 vanadium-dependent haloperoxidase [Wenzhouxiangella sp. XN201]
MKPLRITYLLTAIAIAGWPHLAGADAVTDWNANAGEIAKAAVISPAQDPFHESRIYAMVHIAIHDALNAIDRRSRPYAFDGHAPGASADAAVAAAAHGVLVAELPGIPDVFAAAVPGAVALADAYYADALAAIPDGPAKSDGISIGQQAADSIVALRTGDGADAEFLDFAFPEGTAPGEYRFTEGLPFAAAPAWGDVTPFVLNHAAQFRPPPPYAVSCGQPSPDLHSGRCEKYAEDLYEVQVLGGNDATGHDRTPDQTEIALFWIESSPLSWNRLARDLSTANGLDSWENARLFGILNTAMADGYIGSMETKYHYRYWRPETAIRTASSDGNPWTVEDTLWTPLTPTPPIPDYDSAHAVEGASAAEAFRQFFGTDLMAFDVCSLSLPDPDTHCGGPAEIRRSFSSFSDAARENGESRILVGYHFRLAVEMGLEHGRKIGARAAQLYFKPLN